MTSEQRYRNLIENIVDYVVEIDLDGTRTFVSPRVFDVIGYLPNELIGTVGYKSIHPEDLPNVIKTFESGLKSKEVLTVEYRIKHKNGHYLPVSAKGCVVDNSGKPKVVAVITNMTDKKEAKLMFDTIADGVFILDHNYKYRIVNKAAADLVEMTVDQLVDNKITELFPGIEHTPFYKAYEYVMEKRKMQHVVDMFIFQDGHKGYYEVRIFPISEGILCIARNITEEKKAEQKLKESEEKYKALFDSSPYSVILSDMSGNIIDCNANVEKVFGLKNDDVIGKNFRDFALYPPESLPLLIKNFKILLKGEIPEPFEIQIYRKDGSLIWINSQSYFVKIGDETFIHSIVQDITAMKEAEQKIKESEEKFSLIFESAADAVLWADAESGEIIDCNNALETLLEKNKDEIIGKHVTTLNPPEELEQNLKRFKKFIKEGKFTSRETNLISKTGKYIPVLVTGSIASIGGIKIIMAIFHDITNRKQADQKLKESEEKFRKIIENSNEGYFEVDLKGSYTFFNDAFYEILRYPRNELVGLNYKSYMSEKNSKRTFKVFNNVYNTGIPHKSYQYARRKDSKEIYTESSIYLRHDTDGNKIGFGGFLRDITEKREAEQRLIESGKMYREAFARADFFKDLIAHDINNILQNIKLSTELSSLYLNKPDKLNELTEIFEITSNQVNRGAKLISSIIKLTAIENKVKIFDTTETHKILEEAIKSVKNSFQSKNINIQVDSIDKTSLLKANDLLLYLFENILTNAIKYNDRNDVEIFVRFSKFNENGTVFVKVEFIDNGIGIPDDKKIIIFQKGFQKDKSGRGMGLGLTLVKKIIKSYNGQIWVEDKVKGDYTKGSNFIILIPEMDKDN